MGKVLAHSVLVLGILPLVSTSAQPSEPIVIQAASPGPAGTVAPAHAAASATADAKTMTQLLQEVQASNAATIKKQEAALATLDALQKAAEEIKIFSKRG
jgi:hypothetical protein